MGHVTWKQRICAGFLVILAAAGCNPFLLPAYIFEGGHEPKLPAEFPLKPQKGSKEVKVVVLTSASLGLPPDLINVDRMLAQEFVPILEARCKANKEKVTILKNTIIDKYKVDNENWQSQHPIEIGKSFGADYVIDMEIQQMELYEPGSRRQFLRGRSDVSVNVYDLSKALKEPAHKFDYSTEYPKPRPIEVSEMAVSIFRQKFIQRIASDLAVKFTSYTSNERLSID